MLGFVYCLFFFFNVEGKFKGMLHGIRLGCPSQYITYISYYLPLASKLGIKVFNFYNCQGLSTNLFLLGTNLSTKDIIRDYISLHIYLFILIIKQEQLQKHERVVQKGTKQ